MEPGTEEANLQEYTYQFDEAFWRRRRLLPRFEPGQADYERAALRIDPYRVVGLPSARQEEVAGAPVVDDLRR